jgi:hypothetical protein
MKLIDRYVFNARFLPAAVLLLPGGIAVAAWLPKPGDLVSWGQLVMLALSTGGAMLVAQLGRGPGKSKEPALWREWGGPPTTVMLRHRDSQLDPKTKARYHRKLSLLVPDSLAPTPDQETANPADADDIYTSWVSYLRAHTFDPEQFRLLHASNIDYGFRRNLWGMRPLGIVLAGVGCAVALGRVVWSGWSAHAIDWVAIAATILNICLLIIWIKTISKAWVKVTAISYGFALLTASDVLEPPAPVAEGKPEKPKPKARAARRSA